MREAIEKADQRAITNVFMVRGDAHRIGELFSEETLTSFIVVEAFFDISNVSFEFVEFCWIFASISSIELETSSKEDDCVEAPVDNV